MIRKILVPIDGSEHSRKALELACDLAGRYAAKLSILHVVERAITGQALAFGAARAVMSTEPEAVENAARSLLDAAARLAEEHGVRPVDVGLANGPIAKEIVDEARHLEADTIVMGSRGLSDLGGLLLGSVSHKVAHMAACTCIVVR